MDFITTFFVAIGLAMDAFAVSLGIGTARSATSPRSIFRLAFHFGFFQGGMTFLGWAAGSVIAPLISSFDHWVILVLLAWVGGNMIRSGLSKDEEETRAGDPSKGGLMILLCVATSLDALAVGLSMAMMEVKIVAASVIIAVVTLVLSLGGLVAGKGLGDRFGKRMEVIGGLILIGIGIRVVVSHLFV